jgi:hypothetical protein
MLMNCEENRRKQIHIFMVKTANNRVMFDSVCSISATGDKQRYYVMCTTNKYQGQRKIKIIK